VLLVPPLPPAARDFPALLAPLPALLAPLPAVAPPAALPAAPPPRLAEAPEAPPDLPALTLPGPTALVSQRPATQAPAHAELQPPQCCALVETSTHEPSQDIDPVPHIDCIPEEVELLPPAHPAAKNRAKPAPTHDP
jgi:hypothetical protein